MATVKFFIDDDINKHLLDFVDGAVQLTVPFYDCEVGADVIEDCSCLLTYNVKFLTLQSELTSDTLKIKASNFANCSDNCYSFDIAYSDVTELTWFLIDKCDAAHAVICNAEEGD